MENSFPWMVPVPVKKSSFTPLFLKNRNFNLEVDLTQIRTFYNGEKLAQGTRILYADLQTNADINVDRRLGSGRSGFIDGHYLKGIGRTQLACTWNDDEDLYHNSGILLPSSANREFLISAFLKNLSQQELVNPCIEVLLRPMPKNLLGHQDKMFHQSIKRFGRKRLLLPRCNASIQAISVKHGNFSRLSNFTWWLNHFPQFNPSQPGLSLFFEFLYRASLADSSSSESNSHSELDALMVARGLADAMERTLSNLVKGWSLGIHWGSLHNNFTLDGRFLDLETPTIFEFPTMGSRFNNFSSDAPLKQKIQDDVSELQYGFESISYVRQALSFLFMLESQLDALLMNPIYSATERKFISEFKTALQKSFSKSHPLASRNAFIDSVLERFCVCIDAGKKERQWILKALEFKTRTFTFMDRKTPRLRTQRPAPLTLYLASQNLVRAEPHTSFSAYIPGFLMARQNKISATTRKLNDLIRESDEIGDHESLKSFLKKADLKLSGVNSH